MSRLPALALLAGASFWGVVWYPFRALSQAGDWQGVIDKLDYLQTLGVTALWISPVVKNVEEDAGFHSYHGYWTQVEVYVMEHSRAEFTHGICPECEKLYRARINPN